MSSAEEEVERLKAQLEAERAKNLDMEERQTQLKTQLASECSKSEALNNELQQCRKWNVELVTAGLITPGCGELVCPANAIGAGGGEYYQQADQAADVPEAREGRVGLELWEPC